MKNRILVLFTLIFLFSSCFKEDSYTNTKEGNFEALWKIIDERYCFFEYKNIDWDEVYWKYEPMISENMSNNALFETLGLMLEELKDGHVNLIANHDVARYSKWFTDYPHNFNADIQEKDYYLGTDYQMAAGLKYTVLRDNIGYIHYESFSLGIGEGNINQVLYRLASCDGIVFDVRDNGGGFLTNSEKLVAHFINEKTTVGYIQHKKGKGHNDFSKPYAIDVKPKGARYQKPVIVLTNRRCYSATNDFVKAMKTAPNVLVLGDITGGGSGLPFSSELPNGWAVRFSASPIYDADMNHTEFGIEPDIKIDMLESDMEMGLDTMIEKAIEIIKQN